MCIRVKRIVDAKYVFDMGIYIAMRAVYVYRAIEIT